MLKSRLAAGSASENKSPLSLDTAPELIVKGKEIPLDALREKLAVLGDSLLVVGDAETAKVHVHTNNPGQVLEICGECGEMLEIKIDNMAEQNREASRQGQVVETNGKSPLTPASAGEEGQETPRHYRRKRDRRSSCCLGHWLESPFEGWVWMLSSTAVRL